MSTAAARALTWAGLALLGVGLLVGVLPLKVSGSSCGSALFASDDAYGDDLLSSMTGRGPMDRSDRCDDKRSTVRLVVIPFLVLGAGGMLVGGVGWAAAAERARQAEDA